MTDIARSRAKSAHTPNHSIPIGLQIAVRALDNGSIDIAYLKADLMKADAQARLLLHDPIGTWDDDTTGAPLARLAEHFGADESGNKLAAAAAAITPDPHALVADFAVSHQNAGLYLGLCLGFRIAAGLGGKE